MKRHKRDLLKEHPRSVFFSVAGLVVFLLMFVNVLTDGPMLKVDEWVSLHVPELHTETGTKVIVFLTDLNGVVASTILFVLISTFLWYKKRYGDLRFFLFSFLGATLLFNLFKFTVQRTRPDTSLFELATYSFPSGHTTMATVLVLSLYVVFAKRVERGFQRALLLVVCVLWALTIAFTRVYLNVHWFSDVIAGLSLGLFWVTLSTIVYPPYSVRK